MGIEIASAIGLAAFTAGIPIATGAVLPTIGAVLGSTIGGIALSAASFGVQSYLNSRASKGIGALNNEATGIQQMIRQAIPAQRLCVGNVTTSGALFFAESKPPYTWYGLLLAAHRTDGLVKLIINNTVVFLDEDGYATSTPFANGADKYIEVSFRNGDIDQAIDPIIARDFPDMPSTFRQRGHTTAVIKRTHGFGADVAEKNEDYRRVYGDSGQFNPLFNFRGALVHDPRRPDSLLGDDTSWSWSENDVLCLMRYLTHQWPDMRLYDPARVEWDQVALAADECDRWEIGSDGLTFRRFAANGVVQSTDDPFDVIEALKLAMNGDLVIERGKVYPVPGARREPEATFHIGMLIGGFQYQPERRSDELVNIVKTNFVSPDRDYQTVQGPVLRDADAIAAEGRPLEATLTMPFENNQRRAQRHAHYAKTQARNGRVFSPGATLEARGWTIGKVYRVDLPGIYARVNGTYKLIRKTWNADLRGFQLSFLEATPERFDFGPDDEVPFELDSETLAAEAA